MLTIMFPVVDDLLYEKEKKGALHECLTISIKSLERTTYLLVSYIVYVL